MSLDGRAAFAQAFDEGRTTRVDFMKSGATGTSSNTMSCLQRYGSRPAALATPAGIPNGQGYTSDPNSIIFPDAFPYQRYITGIEAWSASTFGGTLFVYDLLVAARFTMAAGSIDVDTLGANLPPRPSVFVPEDEAMIQCWISPTATTAATVVAMSNYSDASGGILTGAPNMTIPAGEPANSMYQLPLDAASQYGGVTYVAFLNCTSGSGTYDLFLLRPLASIALPSVSAVGQAQTYNSVSFLDDYMNPIAIEDGTCIQLAIRSYVGNATLMGSITTAFG